MSAWRGPNLLHILVDYCGLARVFQKYELQYSFAPVGHGEAPYLEESLIKKYVKKYGEAPPLNSVIPNKNELSTWR